jgi:hypothetical protein
MADQGNNTHSWHVPVPPPSLILRSTDSMDSEEVFSSGKPWQSWPHTRHPYTPFRVPSTCLVVQTPSEQCRQTDKDRILNLLDNQFLAPEAISSLSHQSHVHDSLGLSIWGGSTLKGLRSQICLLQNQVDLYISACYLNEHNLPSRTLFAPVVHSHTCHPMFPNPPSPHSSNTSGSDSPSPSPTINQVPAVLALV